MAFSWIFKCISLHILTGSESKSQKKHGSFNSRSILFPSSTFLLLIEGEKEEEVNQVIIFSLSFSPLHNITYIHSFYLSNIPQTLASIYNVATLLTQHSRVRVCVYLSLLNIFIYKFIAKQNMKRKKKREKENKFKHHNMPFAKETTRIKPVFDILPTEPHTYHMLACRVDDHGAVVDQQTTAAVVSCCAGFFPA